jgi:hypothetical protein
MFIDIEPAPFPLERKLWILHFNGLLETGTINPDILPYLDSYQQFAVNEVKKYSARKRNAERGLEDKYQK